MVALLGFLRSAALFYHYLRSLEMIKNFSFLFILSSFHEPLFSVVWVHLLNWLRFFLRIKSLLISPNISDSPPLQDFSLTPLSHLSLFVAGCPIRTSGLEFYPFLLWHYLITHLSDWDRTMATPLKSPSWYLFLRRVHISCSNFNILLAQDYSNLINSISSFTCPRSIGEESKTPRQAFLKK